MDPQFQTDKLYTHLHKTIIYNDTESFVKFYAQVIQQRGNRVYIKNMIEPALCFAAMHGRLEILQIILADLTEAEFEKISFLNVLFAAIKTSFDNNIILTYLWNLSRVKFEVNEIFISQMKIAILTKDIHENNLKFILDKPIFDDENINSLFISIAMKGSLYLFKALLDNENCLEIPQAILMRCWEQSGSYALSQFLQNKFHLSV